MSTITPVAVGAAVHGDNASLVPGLPAGIQDGDLLVLFAAIRNTAASAGAVTSPGGWTPVVPGGNVSVVARVWNTGDTAPTCAFTGGSAGDTTSAQLAAFRGASPITDGSTIQTNGSAQNIAYPGLTPTRQGDVVIVGGWKQDDWTSVASLAGMTELGEPSTTTGNDQGLVWDYVIQTVATAVTSGSFVVTGGASAVSKGFAFALKPLPTLTVTEQDVYPPRVLVSVTDLAVGDSVEIYRVVSGARTLVRAGSDASVSDPSFLRVDAELPFGVPVTYVAVVNGVEYSSAATTYTLPGGKVALSDAVGGQVAEVVIMAWPEKTSDRDGSTFRAGGRNIARLGDLTPPSSTVDLYVETTSSVENLQDLLAGATEGTVQIRQPGGYDGVDGYLAVLSSRERRFSQDGSDQRRIVALEVIEVEGWAPALEAAGFTLGDLDDTYTGQTLADINADFATLLDIAQAELL